MNIKRAVFMAVLVVAVAALAVPLVGLRAAASGSGTAAGAKAAKARAANAAASAAVQQSEQQQREASGEVQENGSQGKISAETLKALGIKRVANPAEVSEKIGNMLRNKHKNSGGGAGGSVSIQSGQALALNARSALSAALITAIGGRDNQFSEVALIADWDGREDCAADREQKVDDFSFIEGEIDQELTRTAISEHTVANGFNENVYYYGDSVGNLWVGTDLNPGQPGIGGTGIGFQADTFRQINIPTLQNTGTSGGFTLGAGIVSGGLGISGCTDDQVVVTGIAVNPVADLCDFGLGGTIGEIVYVSITDTEGCAVVGATNVIGRSSIYQFAFVDAPGGLAPAGARRIFVSTLANFAGVAVDDDGSLYFQLVDVIQFTGGAIFKLAELPRITCGGTVEHPCISRVIPTIAGGSTFATPLIPSSINFWQNTAAFPIPNIGSSSAALSAVRATNYSGPSTLFGNIVAITAGPCNVIYAAVSASFVGGPVSFDQLSQGLFPAPAAFGAAGTPSMVISFADCSGLFDICSGDVAPIGCVDPFVGGTLPVADGFADAAANGLTRSANNDFRIFVQGNGPSLTPAVGGTAIVPGTPTNALKVDMQIDFTPAHSGIAVSQEGTVFVISGGSPAGVGKSPSPMLGEVLCFEDICPADRRADFVDLRGDTLPNPPSSGGNVGDGDSDRFDHIFYQSPIDVNTATPAGLAGLNFGFLRYTARLAPNEMGRDALGNIVALGVTQRILGDDDTTGPPIIFEFLDPGHQVAGGDDQNPPNRGDDSDTVGLVFDGGAGISVAGFPPIPPVPNSSASGTALNGGFEFAFGGPGVTCVWNGFFLNSNGNLTFGTGDTSRSPSVLGFRAGQPIIAPAKADLNPNARALDCGTFPVMAVGFVNVNAFKTRWINVPEFGKEACTAGRLSACPPGETIRISNALIGVGGASNTFSVTLYDDGTGADENTTETLSPVANIGNNLNDGAVSFDRQEGPTDNRFTRVSLGNPVGGSVLVGCSPRPSGSGIFVFDYCRMDLLGTPDRPVLTGYSIGRLSPLNPPGLCETNLSVAAAAADAGAFGLLVGNQIAAIGCGCCIGEGTEPTIFEFFNEGRDAGVGSGGEVTFARPDFDLRFEGNDAAACTSSRQRDLNRGKVCFLGVACEPPANPICQAVVTGVFVTTPTTTGLVNALCAVPLNIVGCGFFPNEVTIICEGFAEDTGQTLRRPGKTVTTAATLACDTNGDSILDATIVLGNVTPVNCNLVTATILPLSIMPGTGFPDVCCGGTAVITVTTTFTAGDNNVFGAFIRTATCTLALGTRAPVVYSVTPSNADCSLPFQDLLVSGACFCDASGTFAITSAIFQDVANPANTITVGLTPSARGQIKPLSCNLFDVLVSFTSANAGKTFLFFAVGPGGTSRNLGALPQGSPVGCPIGNEQGFQPSFKCNTPGTPGGGVTPIDIAKVTSCKLDRQATGQFILDVVVEKGKPGLTVTVGGIVPKKVKVLTVESGTNNPTLIRLVKKFCGGLPGNIVITNPGAAASAPFLCTERCPAN